ncbi:MAG TPA: cytochrome c biogenesis protein CcsA [bacterium]|nr:cytochrome c biogenesis protein CcsA [bacterium]
MMNVQNMTLWLAGLTMLAAIVLYARARDARMLRLADRMVYAHLGLLSAALVLLLVAFLADQFQFAYVAHNSSLAQELFYKISAVWAGQEGTFLLWAWMVAVMAVFVIRRGGEYHRWAMVYVLATQAFLMLLLFVRSPFAPVEGGVPADGSGMNPLLKDPWMVIHPPIVFIGYAAFTIPFAYVIAALTMRSFRSLATTIFPWVAFATVTLGAGIFIGGFWAYKVLGWGGYWGWDPVENASLVPWLTGMALLHALILYRTKGQLPKTTMWLACVSYILVVYGTFLTRSGVLSDFSVHSFADAGINSYLSAFLFIVAHISFIMLLMRGRKVTGPPIPKAISSREFGLVTGVLLFCLAAAFVILGTSSPILTGLVGNPSNVAMSYYNQVSLPIGILIALVLGFSPFLLVERTQWGELFRTVIWSIIAATVVTVGAILLTTLAPLHAVLIFVSVAALASNGLAIWRFSHGHPLRMAGHLTHLGFAVMLLGIIASAAYSGEETLTLRSGETGESYGTQIQFLRAVKGETTEDGYLDLRLVRGNDTTVAHPKLYISEYSQQVMRTPHIEKGFLSDLYIAPLDHQASAHAGHGLTLTKGQTSSYGGWNLSFVRYDMSQHGEGGAMKVGAVINAEQNGTSYEIIPSMESTVSGKHSPIVRIPGTEMGLSLVGMSVEQRSVTLEIDDPTTGQMAGGESLVLSVSRKPLTSLVWAGCILITLGTGFSYWRRRVEEKLVIAHDHPASAFPGLPKGGRLKTTLPH